MKCMSLNEQEIINARERLFKNVVEYFRSCKGVKAIFIGGSAAEGSTDAYSDIDFRIVVAPEFHSSLFRIVCRCRSIGVNGFSMNGSKMRFIAYHIINLSIKLTSSTLRLSIFSHRPGIISRC